MKRGLYVDGDDGASQECPSFTLEVILSPSRLHKWGGQLASSSFGHLMCSFLMICLGWRLRAKIFLG